MRMQLLSGNEIVKTIQKLKPKYLISNGTSDDADPDQRLNGDTRTQAYPLKAVDGLHIQISLRNKWLFFVTFSMHFANFAIL